MLPTANSWAVALAGGLLSVLGNAPGTLPAIALVSLGVGAIVAESVVVFLIIKFLGAGYLMYLGVQAIRHRNDHSDTTASQRALVPFLSLNDFDLRNITAGQSHFLVPRAGIEPTIKRISGVSCQRSSLTVKKHVFPGECGAMGPL